MTSVDPPSSPPSTLELPESWRITPLGELMIDVRNGIASGKHNDQGEGLPHLRPMNINREGKITLAQLKYIPQQLGPRIRTGDVLLNNTNSRELVGKTAFFDLEGDWAFSNHMTRLRPTPDLDQRFLAHQLFLMWRLGHFRAIAKQHVNQASISNQALREVPLIVSPLSEQLECVAWVERNLEILHEVQQLIERSIKQLLTIEREIIKLAATGKLVDTEHAIAAQTGAEYEPGDTLLDRIALSIDQKSTKIDNSEAVGASVPSGWVLTRVKDVGHVQLGMMREPKTHTGSNMRPYLRVANVLENKLDLSNVHEMHFSPEVVERFELNVGDILLNEGQSPELVGRPAMYRGEIPDACFQKTLIRFRAYTGVSPTFALLIFRYYLHSGRFRSISRWSTNIAHLTSSRFSTLPFPLPPLREQERIVEEAQEKFDALESVHDTGGFKQSVHHMR